MLSVCVTSKKFRTYVEKIVQQIGQNALANTKVTRAIKNLHKSVPEAIKMLSFVASRG